MLKQAYLAFKREKTLDFIKLLALRVSMYTLGLPIACIILLLSPFLYIRLVRLFSYRIGHYALNTELLLCYLEDYKLTKRKHEITVFYSYPGETICNTQLHKMWKRRIVILPLAQLWSHVDRLVAWMNPIYRQDVVKLTFETSEGSQDKWNYLEAKSPCLSFTKREIKQARELIKQMGINPDKPFVCLLGRDPTYLNSHLSDNDWSYHDYRNVDINTYQKAAEFLANQGVAVLRMGSIVKDKFTVDSPLILDYANHPLRSDFLDMYLSAHCYFFVSPRSGIDAVAQIFRRPLVLINFPLCDYWSLYYLYLFIPKMVYDSMHNRYLLFSKMCWTMERKSMLKILHERGWKFVDNTPEEMIEVLSEMLAILAGTWKESDDGRLLQARFWRNMPIESGHSQSSLSMRIGESFLKKYQTLLN